MLSVAEASIQPISTRPQLRRVDQSQPRASVDTLRLLSDAVDVQRYMVRSGETIYEAGSRFTLLYVLNSGFVKVVNHSPDGREQVVGLKFRGDWLGFDGMADGRYACNAVAMDTGEVWGVHYDALLEACAERPELLKLLHAAMSRETARDRAALISMCTLPATARLAEFLRQWCESLSERGLRTDPMTLPMSRVDIGNYLGMSVETVSRAFTKLVQANWIAFADGGRRDLRIIDAAGLSAFVHRCALSASLLQ